MQGKARDSTRHRPLRRVDTLTRVQPLPEIGGLLTNPDDDLVRMLSKLAADVERFESTIGLQRLMLEHRASFRGSFDFEQFNHLSGRITLEVADLISGIHEALAELRRLREERPS